MLQIQNHSQLVDVAVMLRQNRDGLMETPEQFRFAAMVLGFPG